MVPGLLQSRVAFNAIRMYAALSYLYYEKGESAVSDGEFDELCNWILANYEWIKPHDINGYISKSSMKAGTGFDIAAKVCGQTKEFAESLLQTKPKKAKAESKKPKAERSLNDLLGI